MTPPTANDDSGLRSNGMNQHLIDDLVARVKALEDAVFPPGGPALAAQLTALGDRIRAVQSELTRDLNALDTRQTEKIRKAYEVLAELKSALETLASTSVRPRTMGG